MVIIRKGNSHGICEYQTKVPRIYAMSTMRNRRSVLKKIIAMTKIGKAHPANAL
jgi:L-serine deaminase